MSSTPDRDPDALIRAAQTGAAAARGTLAGFGTADMAHGGYEAADWDSGPNYLPYRPTAASRRRGGPALLAALAILALIAVTVVGLWRMFDSHTTTMEDGFCITTSQQDGRWTSRRADCSSTDQTTYTVVSHTEGRASCNRPYTTFEYLEDGDEDVRRTYCLMENLIEGHCYLAKADRQLTAVDCAATPAGVRVSKRVDGAANAGSCPPDTQPVLFQLSPQRTYCLVKH